ncbi:MAG: exo-alpha-sialidase [Pseudolabrys sp.]
MRHHVLAAIAALATLAAALVSLRAPAWPVAFAAPAPAPSCTGKSVFEFVPFHDARPALAHAASTVMLRDGRLRAVWYQGPRELSPSARIWTATFDGERWSAARPVIGPAETTAGSGRYVNTVGNTNIFRDRSGELALVFAARGAVGGWDGVSLKVSRSRDEGETWSPPRNLTTSAIYNFGTNVRGPAIPAEDGSLTVLPTSHEFARSFPELILLDDRDRVVGKRRIGISGKGSQPFVLVQDAQHAMAFMRIFRGFTLFSRTADAGNSWTEPVPTAAVNRDVPVVVTQIGDKFLMVSSQLNLTTLRWSVVFAMSADGMQWRDIYAHPFGNGPLELPKYPWLTIGKDGLYHLVFSFVHGVKGSELIHVRFSRDWVAEREGMPCR